MIVTTYICPEHGQQDLGLYGTCGMGVEFFTSDGRRGVRACGKELKEIRVEFEPSIKGGDARVVDSQRR